MKYRMLTMEELSHLEEELKQFLIVNHVHKEEWETINKENPALANELVGLFSDQVLERVYTSIAFLEHRSMDSCFVFHLKEDSIEMIALQKKDNTNTTFDFSTPENIHIALTKYPQNISFFKHTKGYSKKREEEIHQMLEQGCVKSTENFWTSLELALVD
jgi:hypothetical protein